MFLLVQKIRGADIGREHALLDDAVGVVAADRDDARDLALVVEDHLRLDRLEIDGAACRARLHQHTIERIQVPEMRQQTFEPSCGD